jgi:exopolysaccharide biosynthesis polyprenyl glycosylphosphotransferase
MTPVQAGSHAASPGGLIAPGRYADRRAIRISARLLDAAQWGRIQLVSDFIVLYLASSLALFADTPVRDVTTNRWLSAIFPLIVTAMMRMRRSPDERLQVSLLETFAYVLGVVSLSAMLTISVDSILGGSDPLGLALRLWLFAAVYLGVARAMLVSVRHQAMRNPALAKPTLIVGAGVVGAHVVKRLLGEPAYGMRPVGFLDADPLPSAELALESALPVLGGLDDLNSAIVTTGARHVILAFSGERDYVLMSKVKKCQAMGVGVSLVPRLYEAINERTTLDHLGGLPLLTLHSVDPRGWQFALKHAFDRMMAAATLLVASPFLLIMALGVRLSSPGPILFRQKRVGRDGREFTMLKFRTMRGDPSSAGEADAEWARTIVHGAPWVPDAAELAERTETVDRTTPFGRFMRDYSLDELPQLLNVFRGEMSLVGPRPERAAYVRNFETSVDRYADRHRVKSGLTGWAQVNGLRGKTSIADRVEWDNYYIQNWSLRLDLRIMVLTLAEVFRYRDSAASRPGHHTARGSVGDPNRHDHP